MKKIFLLFFVMSSITAMGQTAKSGRHNIPLVYDVENTGSDVTPVLPSFDASHRCEALPDPLEWSDGRGRVRKFKDWCKRRGEIAREIQHFEIGTKPIVSPSAINAKMDGDTLKVDVTVNGETLHLTATIRYPKPGNQCTRNMVFVSFVRTALLPCFSVAENP